MSLRLWEQFDLPEGRLGSLLRGKYRIGPSGFLIPEGVDLPLTNSLI